MSPCLWIRKGTHTYTHTDTLSFYQRQCGSYLSHCCDKISLQEARRRNIYFWLYLKSIKLIIVKESCMVAGVWNNWPCRIYLWKQRVILLVLLIHSLFYSAQNPFQSNVVLISQLQESSRYHISMLRGWF